MTERIFHCACALTQIKFSNRKPFAKFCQQNDTDIEYSSPGDQFFNGKVERVIGTLKVKMFTVLKAA